MTDPALLEEYDRRFRADPDPWRFRTSPYERAKREATLEACGPAGHRRILELGAANGVLAQALTPLGDTLVAVEGVPAAAAVAVETLRGHRGARVVEGLIPDAVPPGPYDLVVASEILYYLDDLAYRRALDLLPDWLAGGGRLVAVHLRATGPERPRSADPGHDDLGGLAGVRWRSGNAGAGAPYRLDVFERTA